MIRTLRECTRITLIPQASIDLILFSPICFPGTRMPPGTSLARIFFFDLVYNLYRAKNINYSSP